MHAVPALSLVPRTWRGDAQQWLLVNQRMFILSQWSNEKTRKTSTDSCLRVCERASERNKAPRNRREKEEEQDDDEEEGEKRGGVERKCQRPMRYSIVIDKNLCPV